MNRYLIAFFYLLTIAVTVTTIYAIVDGLIEPAMAIVALIGCALAFGAIRLASEEFSE